MRFSIRGSLFAVVTIPPLAMAWLFTGCGGDSFQAVETGDGGTDAGEGGAPSTDGSTPAADAPVSDGGTIGNDAATPPCTDYTGSDPMCQAEAVFCGRCPAVFSLACAHTDLSKCDKQTLIASAGYKAIEADCFLNATCDGFVACVKGKLPELQATEAQRNVIQKVCDTCAPGISGCVDGILKSDGGADIVVLSDDTANSIASHCGDQLRPDSGSDKCAKDFLACAGLVVAGASVTSACKDGG